MATNENTTASDSSGGGNAPDLARFSRIRDRARAAFEAAIVDVAVAQHQAELALAPARSAGQPSAPAGA